MSLESLKMNRLIKFKGKYQSKEQKENAKQERTGPCQKVGKNYIQQSNNLENVHFIKTK